MFIEKLSKLFRSKTSQEVKIRYNHDVGDTGLYWRVLINRVEHLASNVEIKGDSKTTSDFIENVGLKHHITCYSDNVEWRGSVIILNESRTGARKRHIVKTITWRILGTIDTIVLSWIITGNLKIGLSIGGTEVITKMLLYYLHERAWYKTRFGIKK